MSDPLMMEKDQGGGDFAEIPPCPAGVVNAVCTHVEYIGMHEHTWQGETKSRKRMIILWEVSHLIETEGEFKGKPFMLSKEYTHSIAPTSNLYKDYCSWLGKKDLENTDYPIDWRKMIGSGATLNVIHTEPKGPNGKVYANVASVSPPMDGMPLLIPVAKEVPKWILKKKEIGGVPSITTAISAEIGNGPSDVPF